MIITDGPIPAAHFALLSGAMSSAAQAGKRKRTDLSAADKVWVIRLHEKEPALTQKQLAEALSQPRRWGVTEPQAAVHIRLL